LTRPLTRYTAVAIALHWTIAALILTNIGLAWWFGTLEGVDRLAPTQVHKAIGISVLLLTLARIAWRLTHKPPPLPPMAPWERWAANAVHAALYVFMLAMPLTGWAMVSASRQIRAFPITFGFFDWPAIEPLARLPREQMHQAHRLFLTSHEALAWLAYGLLTLHVGAALLHQFIHRDSVLHRMLPIVKAPAT
jgi:cytochrome b561